MKRRIDLQPEYAEAHTEMVKGLDLSAVDGECAERTRGRFWIAHNPHAVKTFTSKGQRLDPGCTYVELNGFPTALFCKSGGMTLDGTGYEVTALVAAFKGART